MLSVKSPGKSSIRLKSEEDLPYPRRELTNRMKEGCECIQRGKNI